jgi:hypothetical protein
MQRSLELNGTAHSHAHLLLQVFRPRVERQAVEEDWTREIEVVRRGVELVVFVHAVSRRVRKRILLRVELPALMAGSNSDRSITRGVAPSSSKVRSCTLLGSTRIVMPFMSAGV